MLTDLQKKITLSQMIVQLELPDSAYQKAKERYHDLGEWLCREESTCRQFEPRIFPQGSFRLGTAIHPIQNSDHYDLDLSCKLQVDLYKNTITQKELKNLVGKEIELYRIARGIKKEIECKHRCWCLEYADHINFHIDIVPCIPENEEKRTIIRKAILLESNNEQLSQSVSELAVAITDDRHPAFTTISDDWYISNPEGYAFWFESRMKLAQQYLTERALLFKSASIDTLPPYEWKSPLQVCVQLLKRHRDQWSKDDPESKPTSIILTTLAAVEYRGESDIVSATLNILENMGRYVRSQKPRIPNPADPKEDFADKWDSAKGKELQLEKNFFNWLRQAKIDFSLIFSQQDVQYITEQSLLKFGVKMNKVDLGKRLGLSLTPTIVIPKQTIESTPAKPWRM
jgi:hypothetical protein